ncbi:hypothetical protein SCHPADRAFT_1000011 [Schizopora paradoxa]|uniref:Uncharacterized protein n=1 Tax=Schizopora paradoxa TaxID=27342 RepID=A0A0H2RE43_9AGAM|nr:hypothetical protein SCHPADRAFT_1000011 [Schizopora paradoxa]
MPLRNARSPTLNVESRSRTFSGAASSSALARTDGVNDTDDSELVLRRRGLDLSSTLLGGLKAAYFKATPERLVTPKQIADEIRRLRGHGRSTIYERHAEFNDGNYSCPHHEELVSLCKRLVDLSYENASGYAAQRELLALSVEDRIVCELFLVSQPSLISHCFLIDRFGMCNSGDCHRRWSELLALRTFKTNQRLETPQYKCDALKRTFNEYETTANQYIPFAMGLEMQNDDLVLLRQLWETFLNCVSLGYRPFHDIDYVDLCFRNIVSSGKPLAYFASPSQLKYIAMHLIGNSNDMPFVFSTFFPPPKFESRNPKDPYGTKLVIHSTAKNWDIVTASTYAIPFLGAYVKEKITKMFEPKKGKVFHTLSEFIESEYGRGTPLEGTVFAEPGSAFIDLYKIVYDAAISYRRSKGVFSNLDKYAYYALDTLVEPSLITIVTGKPSWKIKERKDWDVPRSSFILAHTVDIDRYHKHEMLEEFKENNAYIDVLNDRIRFQTFLLDPDGICSLTYIPQFWNVSYLRRFQIGSKYFITADALPESKDRIRNLWNREIFPGEIAIDTMPLDGKVLTCLRVDNESPVFNCTGHYPILAGIDFETEEPLYVAVVYREFHSPWYFTTIKDGAPSVSYTDEVGEEHITKEFFVLALRHDPVDLPPPQDVHYRTGAKDPTGPVYWVESWPRKDSHYTNDERLRDDRILEEFLEGLRQQNAEECKLREVLSGFD